MQTWLYLVCGLLLSAYALLWMRLRRAKGLLSGLPSYPQLPLVGNLLQFAGDGRNLFRRLQEMSEKADELMQPFCVWFGTFPVLLFSDPEDMRAITNNFIEKPYYYDMGKCWLGDGLVTAPGYIWKQNIKRLANTFNTGVVEGYQGVFSSQARKLVRDLKEHAGGEWIDVMPFLTYTTLETICQTALGVAQISDSIVTREYYEAFNRSLELLIKRGLNLIMHADCFYRLTPEYRELQRCVAVIHNVSHTVIQKRKLEREKMKQNGNSQLDDGNTEGTKFQPVLDIFLELSETDPQLTEQQIQSEVDTIIVGGQETTASTLSFAMLMLGCNPKVQEKLYEEIKFIFGDSTRPVESADFNQMQYCEAVVFETLRLFPPLPVVMRYSDRELQLKSCRVPKGTGCGINLWGVGRSKRTWGPDAHEFNPDRWLRGNVPANAASLLPFSYGRRACIGRKYAMAMLKTTLASCVRELQFTSEADQMDFKLDLALRPVSGHLIQVQLRK